MNDAVLVPLDGSGLAARILPTVRALAGATGRSLILFQAVPEVAYVRPAEAALESLAHDIRSGGLRVDVGVTCGATAPLILEAAHARGAGMVALTTHGRGGLDRWTCGTVADRVICGADTPVLLSPAGVGGVGQARTPERILIPLDGSTAAEEAIHPATELALAVGARLIFLRVVETYAPAGLVERWGSEADEQIDAGRQEAAAYLEETMASLSRPQEGVPREFHVRVGQPAIEIARFARLCRAGMAVMTTHGAGGGSAAHVGSTTAGTLQRCDVPVLLTRPERAGAADGRALGHDQACHLPDSPVATITANAREIDLLRRGLDRLLGDVSPAESAHDLLVRLRQAEASLAAGAGRHN